MTAPAPPGTAISVDALSKRFRVPYEKKRTIFEHFRGLLRGQHSYEDFWALRDVSFSVEQGETFGIIGANGSGKSTLLMLLAGVLWPDAGKITINGRIAPFLALGVGFVPELTARENVYLYGTILGLSRKQIDERYEEIFEFSGLKRFEQMKLRNFSSGMQVRLAFSTAIQTEPDIMLVDEVLSVGDAEFRKKCDEKIEEIRDIGRTIVLVTHEMDSVKQLCDECVLLHRGQIVERGDADLIVARYLDMALKGEITTEKAKRKRRVLRL